MECPICKQSLVMSERQGIEIDYCPNCRGVWLDRGELDKIIEKSTTYGSTRPVQSSHDNHSQNPVYKSDDHYGDHHKHKKESWLGDIFDF